MILKRFVLFDFNIEAAFTLISVFFSVFFFFFFFFLHTIKMQNLARWRCLTFVLSNLKWRPAKLYLQFRSISRLSTFNLEAVMR